MMRCWSIIAVVGAVDAAVALSSIYNKMMLYSSIALHICSLLAGNTHVETYVEGMYVSKNTSTVVSR